jgi:hypothetical protein
LQDLALPVVIRQNAPARTVNRIARVPLDIGGGQRRGRPRRAGGARRRRDPIEGCTAKLKLALPDPRRRAAARFAGTHADVGATSGLEGGGGEAVGGEDAVGIERPGCGRHALLRGGRNRDGPLHARGRQRGDASDSATSSDDSRRAVGLALIVAARVAHGRSLDRRAGVGALLEHVRQLVREQTSPCARPRRVCLARRRRRARACMRRQPIARADAAARESVCTRTCEKSCSKRVFMSVRTALSSGGARGAPGTAHEGRREVRQRVAGSPAVPRTRRTLRRGQPSRRRCIVGRRTSAPCG